MADKTLTFAPGIIQIPPIKPLVVKRSPPTWMKSHERFMKGEMCEVIAATQENNKVIATRTVISHLLKALFFGKKVDLNRLVKEATAVDTIPDEKEWETLEQIYSNPHYSFDTKDIEIIQSIYAPARVEKDQRSPEETRMYQLWFTKVELFKLVKLGKIPFQFKGEESCEGDSNPSKKIKAAVADDTEDLSYLMEGIDDDDE
eukprot:m.65382 g.65382  ORF g.65382 m.65382 type:complete len:202 (+) comp11733_c0_seq1:2119-2724(+)